MLPRRDAEIDHSVACHRVNVNSEAKPISHRRHHQSPEKAQAAKEIVEGLLQAKFISEIN